MALPYFFARLKDQYINCGNAYRLRLITNRKNQFSTDSQGVIAQTLSSIDHESFGMLQCSTLQL